MDTKPPIITVKEARKLLGVATKNLSDQQIAGIINGYETLTKLAINSLVSESK